MSEPRPVDTPAVLALVDEMKRRGVRAFALPGIHVEFAPASPDVAPMRAVDKPAADEERCACGHEFHAHNGGLCLHGCSSEKCEGEKP